MMSDWKIVLTAIVGGLALQLGGAVLMVLFVR